MASHPEEPIVALDNINKHDPEALECPVERAFDVVATCFQEDPLTRFFAKPGKEKEYCSCLLRALRQEHFIIYECCTFSAVALVTDTGDLPMGYLEDKDTPQLGDPEAIAALANEDTKSLGLLGFSDAEANLLALVRRDALQAMLKFRHDKKRLLLKYKENSKREVLHIQFMATTPEVQHKGLAAKLFHHLEATADAHNKDLVIMNTQPRTASLFAEHGFRPWQEYRVGGEEVEGGPVIQILARPPKGGKGQAGANGHPAAHEN